MNAFGLKGNKMYKGRKRVRIEDSIKRIESQIEQHEKGVELTTRILEDKKLKKTSEEIEKIRKKKLERAKVTLENTKVNIKAA